MITKILKGIAQVLFATALLAGPDPAANAESPADLLEQGLYAEQTVGDLDAAIAIYERIVESAGTHRHIAAEARYRLAACHRQQGRVEEARAALESLIRHDPEQTELVAQARRELAELTPAPRTEPAPWPDGELLTYRISLPSRDSIGTVYHLAQSAVVDGLDVWSLEIRRLVLNSADNAGVSRVEVDRRSQRPVRSLFSHGVLGRSEAVYGPEAVRVTSGDEELTLANDARLYDNEQFLHLARTLPLAPGFSTRLRFLPTWTGKPLEIGLEVTGTEPCSVPAGTFDCHVVKLDNGQSLWFSTGPERYLVKLREGTVQIELAEIGRLPVDGRLPLAAGGFGFRGELPEGWLANELEQGRSERKAVLRLLDPTNATISSLEVDRCPESGCPSLEAMARRELQGAQERFEGYALRDASWTDRRNGDRQVIGFIGDYVRNGEPWVQYRVYTLVDDSRLEFIFRLPAERLEALRGELDAVVDSVRED